MNSADTYTSVITSAYKGHTDTTNIKIMEGLVLFLLAEKYLKQ